jgi:hypothetical protein
LKNTFYKQLPRRDLALRAAHHSVVCSNFQSSQQFSVSLLCWPRGTECPDEMAVGIDCSDRRAGITGHACSCVFRVGIGSPVERDKAGAVARAEQAAATDKQIPAATAAGFPRRGLGQCYLF